MMSSILLVWKILHFGILKISLKKIDVHFLWHFLVLRRKYYLPFVSIVIQTDTPSNLTIKLMNSLNY